MTNPEIPLKFYFSKNQNIFLNPWKFRDTSRLAVKPD